MKATKNQYLKHVLKQLEMAYFFERGEYISKYSNELDKIINNKIKFNNYENNFHEKRNNCQ